MPNKTNYFVLKERAVPEVLLKVVEAKRLLDSGKTAFLLTDPGPSVHSQQNPVRW